MHLRAFDFDHGKRNSPAIFCASLQLPTDFNTGWKLGFRNGLQQGLIPLAKRVCGLQFDGRGKACGLPFESRFYFGKGVAIAPMQVGHRLFAFIQQCALWAKNLVANGNGGIFFNFHG